jgi:tRNA(Ile2) C34 agmatinyltransferase TiaS
MGLVIGGFLSFVFGNWFAITTGLLTPLQAALASFVLLGLGVFVYGRSASEASLESARFVRRSGSALALACPYCGTPMRAFGSGVANCAYCGTRFRVP